jgi:EpsI family protein
VPPRRVALVAFGFAGLWAALALYRPVAAPLARPLATLPLVLGDWRASGSDVRSAPWWRDADDALRRTYLAPDGGRVEVAIGYFAVQAQGREAASHLSAPLHRAMVGVERLPVPEGPPVPVGRVRLPVTGGHRDGVFWYDVGGRIVTSQASAKLAAGRSALTSREAPGLIVVVLETDRTPDGPAIGRPAMRLAAELVGALGPVLGRHTGRAGDTFVSDTTKPSLEPSQP